MYKKYYKEKIWYRKWTTQKEYYILFRKEIIWQETIIYGWKNYIEDRVELHEEELYHIIGELYGKETK